MAWLQEVWHTQDRLGKYWGALFTADLELPPKPVFSLMQVLRNFLRLLKLQHTYLLRHLHPEKQVSVIFANADGSSNALVRGASFIPMSEIAPSEVLESFFTYPQALIDSNCCSIEKDGVNFKRMGSCHSFCTALVCTELACAPSFCL